MIYSLFLDREKKESNCKDARLIVLNSAARSGEGGGWGYFCKFRIGVCREGLKP